MKFGVRCRLSELVRSCINTDEIFDVALFQSGPEILVRVFAKWVEISPEQKNKTKVFEL